MEEDSKINEQNVPEAENPPNETQKPPIEKEKPPTEMVAPLEKHKPKPSKTEQPGPFLLEVTPEELVVPSTGNLEVKIQNPTDETVNVHVYFDSFFWLMKVENEELTKNHGSSRSMCFGTKVLEPGEVFNLNIGYHDAKYKGRLEPGKCYPCCNENCEERLKESKEVTVNVPPCKRKKYNYDRPEGQLLIKYHLNEIYCRGGSWKSDYYPKEPDNSPVRVMDLHLKEETEEYKKYRERFLEIRKEQARRARWGHLLINEDGVTIEKIRDFKYGHFFQLRKHDLDISERLLPTDLKRFDSLSDEEILKIRKERHEEYTKKLKEAELILDYPKAFIEPDKTLDEWIRDRDDKEKSKVEIVEKPKCPEDPPQKVPTSPKMKSTKSKIAKASKKEQQVVKKLEDPPQKVSITNSTNSKVTVTSTTATNQNPVEKPNATKNKKKKANPCCIIM